MTVDWLNIHIPSVGRSPEYVGSSPAERGTWLSVLLYACQIECGGRIVGAATWKDRQWQQAAGVTLEEVLAADRLLRFDEGDLVINGYPIEVERKVRKNRRSAKAGGMALWAGRRASSDAEIMPHGTADSMPHGMPHGKAHGTSESVPHGYAKGEGEGEGEIEKKITAPAVLRAEDEICTPSTTAPAVAQIRSWMDWRLTIGRSRVFLDREGNSEAAWAELFARAGWDEFTKAWEYCAERTAKRDGKVFLSDMLGVIS